MKKQNPTDAVLGIFVSPRLVEAVLLRPAGEHVQVVRRFVRQRIQEREFATAGSLATALPGLKGSDEADYSLQVGDGSSGSGAPDLFLASEFGLGGKKTNGGDHGEGTPQSRPSVFAAQLKDILAECRSQGYENPDVVFCSVPPDVAYVELSVSAEDRAAQKNGFSFGAPKKAAEAGQGTADVRRLHKLLADQHPGAFDRDRVAYLPMAPVQGKERYLAVVPEQNDSVSATLNALLQHQGTTPPAARLMDAELSLYAALARKTLPAAAAKQPGAPAKPEAAAAKQPAAAAPKQTTAVVRVGAEDTLILFFTGTQLRHYERLRSLTTYDAAETVCSRVLLQQDEQKIGEVHHLLIHTEGRAEKLLETFQSFYPKASIRFVQDVLLDQGVQLPREGDGALTPGTVPAVGVALRWLQAWNQEDGVTAVDLLPKKLHQKRKRVLFAWHTAAVLLLLFGATFYFTNQYMKGEEEIRERRLEQQLNPIVMPVDNPALLKARVDSLTAAYHRHTHALKVLDSLLVGSDRWSRFLEKTTRSTGAVTGIWLTAWQDQKDGTIRMDGTALTRTQVAQFARRLKGSIEKLASYDIKNESKTVKVYEFTIKAPLPSETPHVAQYLQDVAMGHIQLVSNPQAEDLMPEDHDDTPMSDVPVVTDFESSLLSK